MSLDGVILPFLMLLGMMSLSVASIYISARIAMKRLGLTKKASLKIVSFASLWVLLLSGVMGWRSIWV
ncbi:hypothetical protein D1093_09480 [Bartonella kosoyi]|uniref:Uncharacterized protein n=1 Tax=Bartonella kosoyi TaxID=2133959 RepID=A0A5B9CYI8_9HYPH|nr:hypothetical protein [Bartonella kosoyi]QEE09783.1 hypothetical protein D1093_09480 [Bartonella kosoyi]